MGFLLQVSLAIFIFKVPLGQKMFLLIGEFIRKILDFAYEGGVLTGKAISYGGSLARKEATGFGLIYFMREMLKANGLNLKNKKGLFKKNIQKLGAALKTATYNYMQKVEKTKLTDVSAYFAMQVKDVLAPGMLL